MFIDDYLETHTMPAHWRRHQETPVLVINRVEETAEWAIVENSREHGRYTREYRVRAPYGQDYETIEFSQAEAGGLEYDEDMAELAEQYADDNIILFFMPEEGA